MIATIRRSIVYQYAVQLIRRYREDELSAMSAQITFYLILAFFPFLFFLINLLSFTPISSRLLFADFNAIIPKESSALVRDVLVRTLEAKSPSLLLWGMIGSLWAASQGMYAIIRGLNHSYDAKETRSQLKLYLIANLSTVGASVMIILSFFIIVFGRIIGSYFFGAIGEKAFFNAIWPYFRFGITFLFMAVTYYLSYRYLPNKQLPAKNIMVGTVFASFGWVSASLLYSYYVNSIANYASVYGSLAGGFALIIWLYISALIILLGGELIAISNSFEREKQS